MVQKKYILDNGLDATIDNLYKAEYSAGGTGESYSVPSIEENTDFSQLDEQIQKMLQDTGFEITDENIEDSRWLLENDIPLTAENLERYQSLKDLRLPQDNEVVLKAITDAIAQGKASEGCRSCDHQTASVRRSAFRNECKSKLCTCRKRFFRLIRMQSQRRSRL